MTDARQLVDNARSPHQPADVGTLCRECEEPYPCPAAMLLDKADARLESRRRRAGAPLSGGNA